ncbi:NAD(P)H-dependent flavin oxidoreductase [Xanthobacter sediminis]|uniref:NAD(P)H-dependent flavin oxidoreductase n=1 Tax=Xanthobacter sediminis TaxID=3119926 RepID=UPI00372B8C60
MTSLLHRLGLTIPLIQAPMAGTSTPALAAAVSAAGGLGSIALGAVDAAAGRQMIAATRALTDQPFNVNVFCHAPAVRDAGREAGWLKALAPAFARFGATAPVALDEIYRSFLADPAMEEMLLDARPAVVSFHFGLPSAEVTGRLKAAGVVLLATATSLAEARLAERAGIDAVVAQGYEAGGHRGQFDPAMPDDRLSTLALVQVLARETSLPVIAAGGIMTGGGIAAALACGATAAQLGTAFIACPESAADAGHRAALFSDAAHHTVMTDAISGRPARCLANGFTALAAGLDTPRAAYPVAYDAGKALNTAAKAAGDVTFGAQWAGQGAPLARALPAGELCDLLMREYASIRAALAVR